MSCSECGEIETTYNEKIGETECVGCGLILITELFEETVSAYDADGNQLRSADWLGLGSKPLQKNRRLDRADTNLQTGINMTKMLLGSFVTTKLLRSRVEVLYIKAFRKNLFSSYNFEDRATALVYYILRENGIPYTMKEIAKEYNSNVKVAYVIVKRLSNVFGKTLKNDARAFAEKYATQLGIGIGYVGACGLVADYFDRVVSERDENLTPSSGAAICWIVAKSQYKQLTQKQISEVSGVCTRTIYVESKRLLDFINTSIKEIEGKGISELI